MWFFETMYIIDYLSLHFGSVVVVKKTVSPTADSSKVRYVNSIGAYRLGPSNHAAYHFRSLTASSSATAPPPTDVLRIHHLLSPMSCAFTNFFPLAPAQHNRIFKQLKTTVYITSSHSMLKHFIHSARSAARLSSAAFRPLSTTTTSASAPASPASVDWSKLYEATSSAAALAAVQKKRRRFFPTLGGESALVRRRPCTSAPFQVALDMKRLPLLSRFQT
jgi:hypothetical protein